MGVPVKQVLIISSALSFTLTLMLVWRYLLTLTNILAVTATLIVGLLSFLCANLYYRLPDDVACSLPTILYLYLHKILFFVMGHWTYNRFNQESRDVKKTQEQWLLQLLDKNKDTVYGKENDFKLIKSMEDFVKSHKLTTYQDFKLYIDRQAEGELEVLTKEKVVQFGTTSGTTGPSNILPMVQSHIWMFLQCLCLIVYSEHHYLAAGREIRPHLRFSYPITWGKAKCGIPIAPGSSAGSRKSVLLLFTSPIEAYSIEEEGDLCYIHWLFALRHRSLGIISSTFAPIIYNAMMYLEVHWKDIVNDIEHGFISSNLRINDNIRAELNTKLEPLPRRAEELRKEFRKGFDGIVLRVWPHCHIAQTVDSGSLTLYGELLRNSYCKGMTFYSSMYASTEGMMAVNMWPQNPAREYALMPTKGFYEFIPEKHSHEEQPKTLFSHQVKIGKSYEIVLTSVNGLYRYRIGDVVKVTRLHNECPVIEFMYRKGQLLNIIGEKTPEPAMLEAVTRTVKEWPSVQLVDYCCALSVQLNRPAGSDSHEHYVVFVELSGEEEHLKLTKEQKTKLDATLCDVFELYGLNRGKGTISPLEVQVLRPGAFEAFRQLKVQTTAAHLNQFKVPRTLKNKQDVEFMINNILT